MSARILCPECSGSGLVERSASSTSFTSFEPRTAIYKCSACGGQGFGVSATWSDLCAYRQEPIQSGSAIFDRARAAATSLQLTASRVLLRRSSEYMEDGREGATHFQRGTKRELAFCLHPDGSLGALERRLPEQTRWKSADAWSDWAPSALADVSDFLIEFDFTARWARCSDGWCDDDGFLERGDDVGTLARSSSIQPFTRQVHTTSDHTIRREWAKGDGLLAALESLGS